MHSLLEGEYEHTLLQEFSLQWHEYGGGTWTWVVQVVLSFSFLGASFPAPPTPADVGGGGGGGGVAYLAGLCVAVPPVV